MRCIDAWTVLAAYIVLTVCFLAVHTKVTFDTFSVCLMLLVFTCFFFSILSCFCIALYCTLFRCCTRYSVFLCRHCFVVSPFWRFVGELVLAGVFVVLFW